MIRTLTREQMLDIWKVKRAVEPRGLNCTISRTDALDVEAQLEREMRAWYLALLDDGDPTLVAVTNLSDSAAVTTSPSTGLTTINLPEGTRRPLFVRFEQPEQLIPISGGMLPDASNPFDLAPQAGWLTPREVVVRGVQGALTTLLATTDPGPATYQLDDRALTL